MENIDFIKGMGFPILLISKKKCNFSCSGLLIQKMIEHSEKIILKTLEVPPSRM